MGLIAPHDEQVLVVEHDPGLRAEIVEGLGQLGHHVVGAATGSEAERLLDAFSPTAVISEIGALGDGGARLVERIRSRPGMQAVPILVMGDAEHTDDFQDLLPLGHVLYIARGAEWTHLERTFQTMVSKVNEVAGRSL